MQLGRRVYDRPMTKLRDRLVAFTRLVEQGHSLDAIAQFYAHDVIVFENRERMRAGLEACLAFERAALKSQPEPQTARALRFAADDATGTSFVEWVIRFRDSDGRPMRLEEVAVQRWDGEKICEERFYYEGFIDEGD